MAKKTVLMVTSVFPRFEGDATPPFVLNQARAIIAEGWHVIVLAPHGEGARWRENIDGVEVMRFPYFWPLRLQKLCYEGGMLVNFRTRPWTKLLLPFFAIGEFFALVWAIWLFRPDVLHSHSLVPQGWIGMLAASLFDLPHVTTAHGNDVFGLKKDGLMGRLKRAVLRGSGLVTVNSQATREAVFELGCDPSKIELIPAAPNHSRVDGAIISRLRSEWGREVEVVLFVGRMIKEKGVGELIAACAQLMVNRPMLRLVVAGDGPDRHAFEDLAVRSSYGDQITFVGWIEASEVASWMAAADVLAVPSKQDPGGWKEAQGLVAVEAMAVGTPVVASDVGGLPDMIEDGSTGYLFNPRSKERLEASLERALDDPMAEIVIRQAMERYGKTFCAAAVGRKTVGMYRRLLE